MTGLTLLTGLTRVLRLVAAWVAVGLAHSAVRAEQPRIISCAPNLTEILFVLGAGDEVVGVTRFCEHPPEATKLPKLGDLYAPDLEGMVAARPTIIAVTPTSERVRAFFADKPGVRLVLCTDNDSIAEIAESVKLLGEATGRSARAAELIDATNRGLADLRERWKDRPVCRALFVVGRDAGSLSNLYAVGPGTYMEELMQAVRLENVVPASMGEWPALSREALIALNPDIVVEIHDPADDAARAEMRAAWKTLPVLKAVKDDALLPFANKHITVPGVGLEKDAEALGVLVHGAAVPTTAPK